MRYLQKTKIMNSAQQRQDLRSGTQYLFVDVITELLRSGQAIRFQAPGWSMHPTIRDGEIITVEPVMPSAVKQGDIILYRSKVGVIAHRVVRISQKNGVVPRFILRGDALGSPDEPLAAQQILGKVVWLERDGKGIDPYGLKAKVLRAFRVRISVLKRWIRSKDAASNLPFGRRITL